VQIPSTRSLVAARERDLASAKASLPFRSLFSSVFLLLARPAQRSYTIIQGTTCCQIAVTSSSSSSSSSSPSSYRQHIFVASISIHNHCHHLIIIIVDDIDREFVTSAKKFANFNEFSEIKKIRKNSYTNSLNARVGVAFQWNSLLI